jgi:N6-L-threonylcarbamoyladenine synthase
LIILGIETSCDETSASILENNKVLSNIVVSQLIHIDFGGVVPALASKDHEKLINLVVNESLEVANYKLRDLDAVAVTQGPGLIGSLMIGLNYAKGLCVGLNIPLVGINHLRGHIASGFISNNIRYPYLCLLVSGGHTQIWLIKNPDEYSIISTTVDDAAGEAFDKGARILGLKYPGGPEIEKYASKGIADAYKFTIPKVKANPFNFSFSGLKTALLYLAKGMSKSELSKNIYNISASYQEIIIDTLLNKITEVYRVYKVEDILIVGGVSANKRFRAKADLLIESTNMNLIFPDMEYCTDNAAMIAMAGYLKLKNNFKSDLSIFPYSSINAVNNEF